jgi:Protein of unknown function (DUF4012)
VAVVSESRGRRRRRWWIALTVIVIVVIWALVLGLKTLSAYRHDKSGLAALEQVKADLSPGDLTSAQSTHLLDQAHAEFAAAQSDLSSPLFVPITVVPVIGRQYHAVRDLSSAADTVCQVGSSFIAQVHDLLNQPHSAGPDRVASLRRLGALSLSAEHQLAAINTGPTQALFAPLASKHNQFVNQLYDARVRLTKAAAVSSVVATILEGPQTYLVLAANNAEMRAGSGAFLDVGVASTSDGSVNLTGFEPSGDHPLPAGAVNPTGDFQYNWGWLLPGVDFRNLGLTPQFNVTAPLAAQMWTKLTGQPVNGVMALDVAGVKQLLVATGPVVVAGQTVSADNVEQYLLHDQYVGLTDGGGQRQDALGALTNIVLHQLESQSTDLRTLGQAVSSAVAGRNLMMWSSNPVDQAAWTVSGVSGSLTPRSVDVSLINRGGNKLDQYVPIQVAVSTAPSGPHTAVTMTTRLANMTPAGQSQFIAGPFPGVPVSYGGYFGLVALNLPAGASHITMTGAGPLAVNGPDGQTWNVAAPVTIPDGTTTTVVVRFQMPGKHGSMTVVPSARIPAEQWTANGKTFDDTVPTTIRW